MIGSAEYPQYPQYSTLGGLLESHLAYCVEANVIAGGWGSKARYAKLAGVSPQTLSGWFANVEKGQPELKFDQVYCLSTRLGIPFEVLRTVNYGKPIQYDMPTGYYYPYVGKQFLVGEKGAAWVRKAICYRRYLRSVVAGDVSGVFQEAYLIDGFEKAPHLNYLLLNAYDEIVGFTICLRVELQTCRFSSEANDPEFLVFAFRRSERSWLDSVRDLCSILRGSDQFSMVSRQGELGVEYAGFVERGRMPGLFGGMFASIERSLPVSGFHSFYWNDWSGSYPESNGQRPEGSTYGHMDLKVPKRTYMRLRDMGVLSSVFFRMHAGWGDPIRFDQLVPEEFRCAETRRRGAWIRQLKTASILHPWGGGRTE